MKLFVSCVVTLLCIQTIHAKASNQCERKLGDSKKTAATFFRKFQREHNVAHIDFDAIQKICEKLSAAFSVFTVPNYGSNQSAQKTECQIATFFDNFFDSRLKAIQHITHLIYECDLLINISDEFSCSQKYVCDNDTSLSGCEADTNKLNCDLTAFFDGVDEAGLQAKQLLTELLSVCDYLYALARTFDCAFSPVCNDDCSSKDAKTNTDLLPAYETFLPMFGSSFGDAHTKLASVGVICDTLTAAITSWRQRL